MHDENYCDPKFYNSKLNASMRIHELILKPLFGDALAKLFGRLSPKAIENFYQATSHHKGVSYRESIIMNLIISVQAILI